MNRHNQALRIALFAIALTAVPHHGSAQSLLDRPPNMGGTWVGTPGTLYFNFLHRFESTPSPVRKVINYPTFLLGAGVISNLLVGAQYSTNSFLVDGYPNEWLFFGRFGPIAQARGGPFDLSVTAGYSHGARSWDGELTAAHSFGQLRLLAAGRGFSSFRRSDESRWALAGGATLRLSRSIALAGDVATLLDRADDEEVAWGAGVHLNIPSTPHSLSIHISNTNTTTLQGASIGLSGETHWGFEFTIPVTLSRYFGGGGNTSTVTELSGGSVEVQMNDQMRFAPAAIRIKEGTTVVWRNKGNLVHTVTADPTLAPKPGDVQLPAGAQPFDSGEVKAGGGFSHTFTVAGEYKYICLPHVAGGMVGRVIVEK